MKLITILGARPQFIKAAALSRVIKNNNENSNKKIIESIVHTGQHYDKNMSKIFFDELQLSEAKFNLGINNLSHGAMVGRMIEAIEKILIDECPDLVLVYGDTNSTLAGALASVKCNFQVAHIESGLRSFDRTMPEEINRVITDKISSILFCPSENAVAQLKKEGISNNVFFTGDVSLDNIIHFGKLSEKYSTITKKLKLENSHFALMTCHRPENTDNFENLSVIVDTAAYISNKIKLVMPIHPRTKKLLEKMFLIEKLSNVIITEPLSFFDILSLQKKSNLILTDSGGIQKEAFFLKKPCITIRNRSEWIETVEIGVNKLTGPNYENIINAFEYFLNKDIKEKFIKKPYGEGDAANKIAKKLLEF